MEIIVYGLGKMGGGIARNLKDKGYDPYVYNRTKQVTDEYQKDGFRIISELEDISNIKQPKLIWMMLPHTAVDDALFGESGLIKHLDKGDLIVEAGNSHYKDSVRRAEESMKLGIEFVDVGVSGGPFGARNGACMMVGGDERSFEKIEKIISDLCVADGYGYFGNSGAGHYVKMIHNGIEYGMMQSIAEGFSIMKNSTYNLDLEKVGKVYNNGSVIESRLIGWLEKGYSLHGQDLESISGEVEHSGEGLWTIQEGEDLGLIPEVIKNSLDFRVKSKGNPSYTGKVVSLLRNMFGGHSVWK